MVAGVQVKRVNLQRVNVDFTNTMLHELDKMAAYMNISRQAIIKMLLRQSLDSYYIASKARNAS